MRGLLLRSKLLHFLLLKLRRLLLLRWLRLVLIMLLLAWGQFVVVLLFLLAIRRIFYSLLLLYLLFPTELIDVMVIALVTLASVRPIHMLGVHAAVLLMGPCRLLRAGAQLLLRSQLL